MEVATIEAFLSYFGKVRERTLRVVQLFPADTFDWTYKAGKFTVADVVRHIAATERFMWAETVQGRPSRYPGHGPELAGTPHEVLRFFDSMHRESMSIFESLADQDLRKTCATPAGAQVTIGKWLRAMVEHEIHHRGELYVYLGLLDIPAPTLYGLTSEQVRERSVRE